MHSKRGIKNCTESWENTSLYLRSESHAHTGFFEQDPKLFIDKMKED